MIIAQRIFKPYLEPEEKILALCHRHPIVILSEVFRIVTLGFAVPIFLYYLFPNFIFFFGIWLIVSFFRLFVKIAVWYHDVLLITDVSLMDVYWNGLFDQTSARMEYPMIEGVTVEIKGVLKVIFNYGDVTVQGVGGGNYISLKDAMGPRNAEKLIMSHQERFVTDQTFNDAESLKGLLTSLVRQHAKAEKEEAEQINK